MTISIGINLRGGYVDSAPADDMPGQDVHDALYRTAHDYPGGIAALAARMGVPAGTLQHKVNPNNTTHHITLREAVALMELADDAAALHALAARLGFTCIRQYPDQSGGDPVEAIAQMASTQGDFMQSVAHALGNGEHATANQVRAADEFVSRCIAAIGHTVAMLRRRVRKPPTHYADAPASARQER